MPSRNAPPPEATTEPDWQGFQDSQEFGRLRKAVRSFVFPVTIGFLLWYLLYLIMAAYARDFMDTKVLGNINVGLIFGLLQFVSTFVIAIAYARYADRKIDPLADDLRPEIEGSTS
jgi:uncharacterized membrane protein (DUF485 family)